MSFASSVERLTPPLDWCRRVGFAWLARSSLIRSALRQSDRRTGLLVCANIALAAVCAVYFPVLMFVLGPVLLGVAHVAADVRYLVLRRGLPRWWQNAVWLGCVALIAARALEELGWLSRPERVEFAAAAAFIALASLAGFRESGSGRRVLAACTLLGALTAGAWHFPAASRLLFLHAHNVVGLALWAALFRRGQRWLRAPGALLVGATVLLASGLIYRQTLDGPGASSLHLHLHVLAVARGLAPFRSARLAIAGTTTYLFLQSLHYSAWLSWIPREEHSARGTPTFRGSVRSLFADLGAPGVAAVCVAASAVALGACLQLQHTRALYLSLATFHGYLELALLTYFWVRGTALRRTDARSH